MRGLVRYGKKVCLTKEMDRHLENIVHGEIDVIFQFEGLVMIYFENNVLLYIKLNLRN